MELRQRFALGKLVATPGALAVCEEHEINPITLFYRHSRGDWSELDPADKKENEFSVVNGFRIFSVYTIKDNKFYIITEADRSVTTLLLPDEY